MVERVRSLLAHPLAPAYGLAGLSLLAGHLGPVELAVLSVLPVLARRSTWGRLAPFAPLLLIVAGGAAVAALLQEPIRGTHRWVTVGPLQLHAALFLSLASVLFSATATRLAWRVPAVLASSILLAFGGSFTLAAITTASCACAILARRERRIGAWIAIIGVSLTALFFTLEPNRVQRVSSFVSSEADNYQVRAARTCQRASVFLGESSASSMHLPCSRNDFALTDVARRLGRLPFLLALVLMACVVWRILDCGVYGSPESRPLAWSAACFLGGAAAVHAASNARLIPPIGIGFPFLGSGGASLLVYGALAALSSTAPTERRRVSADDALPIAAKYASVLALPLIGLGPVVAPRIDLEVPVASRAKVASKPGEPWREPVARRTHLVARREAGHEDAPHLLLLGGIHGDERLAGRAALVLFDALEDDALEGVAELTVLPLVNRSGWARHTRQNDREVDINRNFPAHDWDPAHPGAGPAPASETETRLVMEAVRQYGPDVVVAVHDTWRSSYLTYDGPAERRSMAEAAALECGWPLIDGGHYETPGSFGSWAGDALGLPVVTVELDRRGEPEPAFAALARLIEAVERNALERRADG